MPAPKKIPIKASLKAKQQPLAMPVMPPKPQSSKKTDLPVMPPKSRSKAPRKAAPRPSTLVPQRIPSTGLKLMLRGRYDSSPIARAGRALQPVLKRNRRR